MTERTSTARFQLGPSSLTEALYESLRERIVNGDISPGERLTEQRIAGEYEVARPTAKACLEKLTALGLLRRTTHKTAVVPDLDQDDIADLFFGRELVESAAASRLASDRRLPRAVEIAQREMVTAVENEDFRDQVAADIAFHTALVDAVASARLSRMYETIAGEIHLTMGLYQAHKTAKPAAVAQEHDAIIASIHDGDRDTAASTVRDHLQRACSRVLAQHATRRDVSPGEDQREVNRE